MTSKTLMIGLDGAEPNLIQSWAKKGLLPNLKKALEGWYQRDIQTPPGFGDGVFWTSLITGVNAAKHGHFFPLQFNPISYELYDYALDQELGRDPFWHFCSMAGKTVAVIDIYTAPLVAGLNGIQVMDWMIHDRTGEPRSWPSPLIDHLHSEYMTDPLNGTSETEGRTEQETKQFHQNMVDRIAAKRDACVELLKSNDWDLFCIGFCDAHDVGHQSWDFDNEKTDDKQYDVAGDAVLRIYQAMDSALGEIMQAAGSEQVFIIAGLGMERQTPYNSILQLSLGHYCGLSGDRKQLTDMRRQMPYFELPHNMNAGAVRINLKGRELKGVVEEQNHMAVIDDVAEKLLRLRCADTDKPIVSKIVKIHEHYSGEYLNKLPDLLAVWSRDIVAKNVRVDEHTVFPVVAEFKPEMRSGDHSDRALFIASQNYVDDVVTAESVAPTISRSLGVNMANIDACALSKA